MLDCYHFASDKCRSCQWLEQTYPEQLATKQQQLQLLLSEFGEIEFLPAVASAVSGFRNKAKMVVMGDAHKQSLGIINHHGQAVSLTDCPLYSVRMQDILQFLPSWLQNCGVPPYKLAKRKGELKYVLLTESPDQKSYLLRLVLRSDSSIERLKNGLGSLLQKFPEIKVVSINIQPVHMAVLEGETEIFLTEQTYLPVTINQVALSIRAQSFWQTNSQVAATLYQTAADWVNQLQITSMWDLFCGVGGFALHCASKSVHVTGIEIEPQAIECAKLAAKTMGIEDYISFAALDLTKSELALAVPELILVNPPRRGIGQLVVNKLNEIQPKFIIYSSCNPQSMVNDIQQLVGYKLEKVQIFDMFAHTSHYEVLALLTAP